ncbi:MAG: RNA-binding S4 domain-containing protein [Erysipelotrichia bacterium]|jgi:ribosomal 50S subunit-recycling heat shock protein|nr:RNA-binding S4 domain-containing protein [Erysipelotrichia bacterium]
MRLDKFLKVSRLIKRREVAKEVIKRGDVLINQKSVKPSSEVKIGDIITLTLGQKIIEVKVVLFLENASSYEALKMYEVLYEDYIKKEVA